jgi:hypothetical protein
MDNATKCKCGRPSPARNSCLMMAADLAHDLAHVDAALLVTFHAAAAARLVRYMSGDCMDCVYAERKAVA